MKLQGFKIKRIGPYDGCSIINISTIPFWHLLIHCTIVICTINLFCLIPVPTITQVCIRSLIHRRTRSYIKSTSHLGVAKTAISQYYIATNRYDYSSRRITGISCREISPDGYQLCLIRTWSLTEFAREHYLRAGGKFRSKRFYLSFNRWLEMSKGCLKGCLLCKLV